MNMTNKGLAAALGLAAAASGPVLLADTPVVPEVTGVTMAQDASRLVTIGYTLTNAPAVVTVDVQTNDTVNGATVWASIGGAAIQNAKGDVWRKIATNGTYTITWRPDLSWPDHRIAEGGARAVVTAWALDNTPDYMVVDLSETAAAGTQEYYPAADFLPGGLLGNHEYRTTKLVMRKIMAKGVTWTMGSALAEPNRVSSRETTHQVTLTNNYYIGVFEVTQAQWVQVYGSNPSEFSNVVAHAMCPVENVNYNMIRDGGNASYYWPKAPKSDSFLGKLQNKTELDFDLPSEAQWEFAARAGNGSPFWGDGSDILNAREDANLGRQGCYMYNNNGATAVVGSYAPNSWGLYDTVGNVLECCLDWNENKIMSLNGAANVDPENPAKTISGWKGSDRIRRGGAWSWDSGGCRPAYRNTVKPNACENVQGLRVVCTADLQ